VFVVLCYCLWHELTVTSHYFVTKWFIRAWHNYIIITCTWWNYKLNVLCCPIVLMLHRQSFIVKSLNWICVILTVIIILLLLRFSAYLYCNCVLMRAFVTFIPERDYWLRYVWVLAIANPSVICNVHAPYSADWNFRQCFYAILDPTHPFYGGRPRGTPPSEVKRKMGTG